VSGRRKEHGQHIPNPHKNNHTNPNTTKKPTTTKTHKTFSYEGRAGRAPPHPPPAERPGRPSTWGATAARSPPPRHLVTSPGLRRIGHRPGAPRRGCPADTSSSRWTLPTCRNSRMRVVSISPSSACEANGAFELAGRGSGRSECRLAPDNSDRLRSPMAWRLLPARPYRPRRGRRCDSVALTPWPVDLC